MDFYIQKSQLQIKTAAASNGSQRLYNLSIRVGKVYAINRDRLRI